jgi:flagellar hook protein FlgE
MSAQGNRLGTVADNIANSSTTGYKRASAEFSSLVLDSGGAEYVSGSVDTHTRYAISEQGSFKFTSSVTDLAVKGNGFFIVSGGDNGT